MNVERRRDRVSTWQRQLWQERGNEIEMPNERNTNMKTRYLILLVGWLAGEGTLHAVDAPIDFPVGLPALERMELLPLLPPNGTQTKQFISYDTSGGNGRGFHNFKRYVQDGEWVFFDEMGPGCLYRLQMNVFRHLQHAADQAHIRFRFEDEKEPRIDMTFAEFFGKGDKYPAPFTPPLAYFDMIGTPYTKGGGFAILYHPFSFQKRLRISAWHPEGLQAWDDTWYQFTYLKFPSSTPVATWAGRSTDSESWRAQWNNLGHDPKPVTRATSLKKSVALKKGKTVVLLDRQGAGSLSRLNLAMKPWNRNTFAQVRLRITWDDHATPDVDMPVGCFFGGGGDTIGKDVAAKSLKTLMFGYDGTNGTGYSYWPMPYWKRAKIEAINDSPEDLEAVGITADLKDMQTQHYPRGKCGYFGAKRTLDVSPDEAYYSLAFYQRGYGKVVGLMMYSFGFSMDGDEFTYIDGSRTPQIHGDGTEDDHNQGWGGYATQKPLWGGLLNGYDGAYRLYLAESYIFNSEIRINYEHSDCGGGRRGQKTDFVVWYYLGEPGIGNLALTDELNVGDPASEQAHAYHVDGETWFGQTQAAYDAYEQGNPYPTTDDGRAFTNASRFTVKIDPGNKGVRLRRRLNRNLANIQQATVTVDGKPIPDTPWYFCDLPTPSQTAFADTDFEIPVAYTGGKKELTIQVKHVRAEPANANNEYRYQVYCYGRKPLPPPPIEPPSPPDQLRGSGQSRTPTRGRVTNTRP